VFEQAAQFHVRNAEVLDKARREIDALALGLRERQISESR
jgi:hypothetical protein